MAQLNDLLVLGKSCFGGAIKANSDHDLLAHSNEFNFISPGYSGDIYINYRTASGSDGNVSSYRFCNGKGATSANIYATTFYGALSGNASSATKLATARTLSISDTAGGTAPTFDGTANATLSIPKNVSGFNRVSFTTTDNGTSPTAQSIVLNSQETDTLALFPGIGFHIPNKSYGTLKYYKDGSFRFYNHNLTTYVPVYASTFYGALSGNATTATGFASAKTIALTGDVTGSATGGNGSNGWSIATSLPLRLRNYSTSGFADANAATEQGFHYITSKTNGPSFVGTTSNDYRILTTAYSSSWLQQIATDYRNNEIYYRRKENGTWKPWVEIPTFDNVINNTAVGASGWVSGTAKRQLINHNTLAYWNGAYSGTSSNLQYCDRGRFGTIVTKNIGDYATASHGHSYLTGWGDTRSVATTPNDYNGQFKVVGIKQKSLMDIDGSNYSTLMGIRGWSDSSGGNAHELAFTGSGNLYHRHGATTTWGAWKKFWLEGDSVTGAVWNDYAEYRESDCEEFGYVLFEKGDDTLTKTTERLQHFAGISSDTWGFSQGKTERAITPIAVAGRVLVYPYQNKNNYKPGDCVCAAPGGTVDIMTREEIINYPDRIVGIVSCIPEYEIWGGGEGADREPVIVNNRIWIKVK